MAARLRRKRVAADAGGTQPITSDPPDETTRPSPPTHATRTRTHARAIPVLSPPQTRRTPCAWSLQARSGDYRGRARRWSFRPVVMAPLPPLPDDPSEPLDCVCFTLIIDDIVLPDGRTVMAQLGGSGAANDRMAGCPCGARRLHAPV
eukprot:358229-Chlamydomonas_euryale.AAC.9